MNRVSQCKVRHNFQYMVHQMMLCLGLKCKRFMNNMDSNPADAITMHFAAVSVLTFCTCPCIYWHMCLCCMMYI